MKDTGKPQGRVGLFDEQMRLEHVFGYMKQSMRGIKCECVGIVRPTGILGLMNLKYNLFRYEQIIRLNLLTQ